MSPNQNHSRSSIYFYYTFVHISSFEMIERKRPSRNELMEIRGRSNLVFVTVAAKERRSIFDNERTVVALRRAWSMADFWMVGRYVVMPDHLHLFCAPARYPPTSLRLWAKYWKRLVSESAAFPTGRKIWLPDIWDTQIRTGRHYSEKWRYVYQNPVRAGLVENAEDWKWQGEVHVLDWRGP